MLGFIAKGHQCSKTLVRFKAFLSSTALKSAASLQPNPKGDAFTVSYLVNSCGVANDAAKRISGYFTLKSSDNPSSVLNFLKTCGFTDVQIPRIVTIVPKVLHSDPVKTLKPKFDLFASLGVPRESVLKIISNCPQILSMSVINRITPMVVCLKSVAGSDEELLRLLSRSHVMLAPVSNLERNLAVLREFGMPRSGILRLIMVNLASVAALPDRFKEVAEKALAMGFDPRKLQYLNAVICFTTVNDDLWERKINNFKKLGWSNSEFLMAFKKDPSIMICSEKKIERTMDYLINTFGLNASIIARYPHVLHYSLENRIIPRCSVVQLLVSKGMIEKDDLYISSVLARGDEDFLKRFAFKYQEMRDELMDVFSRLKKKSISSQRFRNRFLT